MVTARWSHCRELVNGDRQMVTLQGGEDVQLSSWLRAQANDAPRRRRYDRAHRVTNAGGRGRASGLSNSRERRPGVAA
jgi:hypothetical protein